jgi:hypothetical protein
MKPTQSERRRSERKISETILDFGAPLLKQFDFEMPILATHAAYELVVSVWNAYVTATPRWGRPEFLDQLRRTAYSPEAPRQLAEAFETLSERWRTQFSDYQFAVGERHIKIHDTR